MPHSSSFWNLDPPRAASGTRAARRGDRAAPRRKRDAPPAPPAPCAAAPVGGSQARSTHGRDRIAGGSRTSQHTGGILGFESPGGPIEAVKTGHHSPPPASSEHLCSWMRLALHRKARSSQLRAFVLSAFFVAGELQLHIAHSPVLRRARAPVIPALPVPLNVGGDSQPPSRRPCRRLWPLCGSRECP
jgi:hypothetical protein